MEQNFTFQAMNSFLNQVEQLPSLDFLAEFEEKYHAREFKLAQMTPAFAAEIYHDIFLKFMKNYAPKSQLFWGENELRLYMWVLACHIQMAHLTIEQLGINDWEHFCSILPNKQTILFQYQTISLYKEPIPAKKWAQEQDQLFLTLIRGKEGKYKWSELAKQLYISSNRQFFRTPKQCRQRWLNHLDPNKSKDQWELKEDFILINHVINKGKKWAQIAKLLKNRRNEHSIKNRFKSLVTKQQKIHPLEKQESALIQIIHKKYDNHFTKLRLMNVIHPLGNPSETQIKKQDNIPTESLISQSQKQMITKQIFQVLKSKDGCKIEPTDQPSMISIDNHLHNHIPQSNSTRSENFLNALREERQKQIRADMFLAEDPFEVLKKFFKSKDSEIFGQ